MSTIKKNVLINAYPQQVWPYITDPILMQQWMGAPEMQLEIEVDWQVGHTLIIKGHHHIPFENRGKVLQVDPPSFLQYRQLDSISQLADAIENYTTISFRLTPLQQQTGLTISAENFPTDTIYRHYNFYWQGAAVVLKNFIEKSLIPT